MPSGRHSTVAVPPVKRTVERRPGTAGADGCDGDDVRDEGGGEDGDAGRSCLPASGGLGGADGPGGSGARGVAEGPADRAGGGGVRVGSAASALRTAPSSSGRLCAVPPPSALASCHAPSAPAAVPTATQAAVPTAPHLFPLHHLPVAPGLMAPAPPFTVQAASALTLPGPSLTSG
ncbi:hypothetical protein GCM10018785_46140 [Streptomyces longispororuber]|uniref:Uncharacterized protein n=1 Tax=Streptomyces longispororuber TaxID=68230 RepID=A0A918ZVE5_9ACTN|nr:hypothetical protein GCM10018785_46140 [Streptomyces longispororuber]